MANIFLDTNSVPVASIKDGMNFSDNEDQNKKFAWSTEDLVNVTPARPTKQLKVHLE